MVSILESPYLSNTNKCYPSKRGNKKKKMQERKRKIKDDSSSTNLSPLDIYYTFIIQSLLTIFSSHS